MDDAVDDRAPPPCSSHVPPGPLGPDDNAEQVDEPSPGRSRGGRRGGSGGTSSRYRALLTITCRPPKVSFTAKSTRAGISSASDTSVRRKTTAPLPVRPPLLLALRFIDVRHHDGCALIDEELDGGTTDPAGTAGDDGDLPRQLRAHLRLLFAGVRHRGMHAVPRRRPARPSRGRRPNLARTRGGRCIHPIVVPIRSGHLPATTLEHL